MYRLITLLFLLCLSTLSNAALYKYTDDAGNTHYSDKPISGGTQVKQNKPSVAPPPKRFVSPKKPLAKGPEKVPENKTVKAKKYTSVKILSPEHDQGLRSNNGNVNVEILLSPKLQTKFGHQIHILLDGKKLKEKWKSSSIALLSLDRGTHTISVIVVDKRGSKLKQSETSTFHLLRYSRLMGR